MVVGLISQLATLFKLTSVAKVYESTPTFSVSIVQQYTIHLIKQSKYQFRMIQ